MKMQKAAPSLMDRFIDSKSQWPLMQQLNQSKPLAS